MSSDPKYEIEPTYNIFDNDSGEALVVGCDVDGLGLCSIKWKKSKIDVVFDPKMIPLLIKALEAMDKHFNGE